MATSSRIEWLDGGATWNPVRGCTPCARECQRCYARTFAERWRGISGHPYEQGFDVRLVPEALDLPLRWRKPRRVFVNSMSDLFHPEVPDEYIDRVFYVMQTARHHRFVVLTKRADRMRRFLSESVSIPWGGFCTLGVSVGTRERLPEIDLLRQTHGALRMVSFEPLLEDLGDVDLRGIDVAAIGGESGPGARPCDVTWIRSLVRQCRAAGCAPYVKQMGTAWARQLYSAGESVYRRDPKGADMQYWPADLRLREWPEVTR